MSLCPASVQLFREVALCCELLTPDCCGAHTRHAKLEATAWQLLSVLRRCCKVCHPDVANSQDTRSHSFVSRSATDRNTADFPVQLAAVAETRRLDSNEAEDAAEMQAHAGSCQGGSRS